MLGWCKTVFLSLQADISPWILVLSKSSGAFASSLQNPMKLNPLAAHAKA